MICTVSSSRAVTRRAFLASSVRLENGIVNANVAEFGGGIHVSGIAAELDLLSVFNGPVGPLCDPADNFGAELITKDDRYCAELSANEGEQTRPAC